MRMAEMQISDADFCDRLKDIQVWLAANGFAPSTFTYFFLLPGMKLRVTFNIDEQAAAFAMKFGGVLVDPSDPRRREAGRRDGGAASEGEAVSQ
jgi:hypothetical protein